MNTVNVSPLLGFALVLDAAATAATSAVLLLFGAELESVLKLPSSLMRYAGAFMLIYAVVVAALSRRRTLPRWAVWTVIIGNALWALDCAALAVGGVLSPSALGVAFLLVQAAIVLGFAELQYLGLRRSIASA